MIATIHFKKYNQKFVAEKKSGEIRNDFACTYTEESKDKRLNTVLILASSFAEKIRIDAAYFFGAPIGNEQATAGTPTVPRFADKNDSSTRTGVA